MVHGKKKTLQYILIAWSVVWLFFFVRELVKDEAKLYASLIGRPPEERRAVVVGREFYEFILFCREHIPPGSSFDVEASYDASLDYFWFPYHMYPVLKDMDGPDYIACYKRDFQRPGYEAAASMGSGKYILKRR